VGKLKQLYIVNKFSSTTVYKNAKNKALLTFY